MTDSDIELIYISDIEAALNYLRQQHPSPDGILLAPELHALAEIYAGMALYRQTSIAAAQLSPAAMAAWLVWYDSTPDTPCIAICSTAQGDTICKGCGRTEGEIQDWQVLNPVEKRMVWRRISHEGTAWRYNKYAERAVEQQRIQPS